ncbi:MAG: leucine-rich repeat protein [Bacteroidales bacterium]|nr:leucine-rich repeat protein [Bacteroidales bacterium]
MRHTFLLICAITGICGAYADNTTTPVGEDPIPFQINGIEYIGKGTYAQVTGYTGSDTHLDIPRDVKYDGRTYLVYNIQANAFNGNRTVTSISIPYIHVIGASAFAGSAVTAIELPSTLTTVGESAFAGSDLQTLTFQKSSKALTIAQDAFNTPSLQTIIMLRQELPTTNGNIFSEQTLSNGQFLLEESLPEDVKEKYRTTEPWKTFFENNRGTITGNADIEYSHSDLFDVYTTGGLRLSTIATDNIGTLAPGLYIFRQGAMTKKVLIR